MSSRSPFLTKLHRRNCEIIERQTSLGFLKDAIVTQIQPIFSGREIVDIDIGISDPVMMSVYLRKEVKRKK